MNTYSVDRNEYTQVFVDVTKACNLKCGVCYQGDKKKQEYLDLDYWEKVCKNLSKRSVIRLTGGEPTLHPKLFDIIKIGRKYGHIMSVVSNGITLTDLNYVKELKKASPSLLVGISMDGGFTNRKAYELTNSQDLMDIKLKALQNLVEVKIKRISVGMIVIKNFNEGVIDDLLYLTNKYPTIKYVYTRPLVRVGHFVDYETYTVEELFELVKTKLNQPITRTVQRHKNCCGGCIAFIVGGKYQIGITDMGSEKCRYCVYRGKLTDNYTVEPFFCNMFDMT